MYVCLPGRRLLSSGAWGDLTLGLMTSHILMMCSYLKTATHSVLLIGYVCVNGCVGLSVKGSLVSLRKYNMILKECTTVTSVMLLKCVLQAALSMIASYTLGVYSGRLAHPAACTAVATLLFSVG